MGYKALPTHQQLDGYMKKPIRVAFAGLGLAVVVSAVAYAAAPSPKASNDTATQAPNAVLVAPVSVDWARHESPKALVRDAATVVKATVVSVEKAPPITAEDAKADPSAPDMHREAVRLKLDETVAGAKPATEFTLVHFLVVPPGVPVSGEAAADEPYKVGEQYLLFLKPAEMPGEWQPREAYGLVSLDGRFRIEADDRLRGYLEGGPASQLNAASDLAGLLRESSR